MRPWTLTGLLVVLALACSTPAADTGVGHRPREPPVGERAPASASASPSPSPSALDDQPALAPAPAAAVAVAAAAAPAPRSPYAYANDDPNDDLVVGPPDARPDCHEALAAAGVKFTDAKLAPHREGKGKGRSALVCGAPQVVVYVKGPAGIVYEPTPIVTCTMALALARLDTIVQEEAARAFGEKVVRISQLGTYACREMAAYRGWVSEHSYANAIDLEGFTLKSGRRITVLKSFERGDETTTAAGAFLRAVSRRAYDEALFSNVLTPFFDALHRNHFHVDLGRYRNDGTRPST